LAIYIHVTDNAWGQSSYSHLISPLYSLSKAYG
jgi:hypothetical protein